MLHTHTQFIHKLILSALSPLDRCSIMSSSKPTIDVDVFKEVISDMTQQINTNLTTLNTKVDTITTRLDLQDAKINDLNQRVEKLEVAKYYPNHKRQKQHWRNH